MTASRYAEKMTTAQVEALDHDDLVAATIEYLATRDLRHYGDQGWTQGERMELAAAAYAEPVEKIDSLFAMYSLGLPSIESNVDVREILLKAHRCPPRPVRWA